MKILRRNNNTVMGFLAQTIHIASQTSATPTHLYVPLNPAIMNLSLYNQAHVQVIAVHPMMTVILDTATH
jgi:hypothetical protein